MIRPTMAFLMLAVVGSGCDRDRRVIRASAPIFRSLDQVVTWRGEVSLEENDRVINVSPWVQVDANGGFLVADGQEQQLRLYAPDGRLRGTFGGRGGGPGEFQHLVRSLRLNDSTILASDMMGQLTRFDSTGSKVLGTALTGLGPIYEMAVLDDTSVIIVGRKGGQPETPLVHVWDVPHGRMTASFFPAPQGRPGFAPAYVFTGFADVGSRGDTLAAVFALEDTVRIFARTGREIARLPIPFEGFKPLREPLDPDAPPQEFQRWLGSFSTITDIYWLRDGAFIIQYMDQVGSDRTYSLLRMSREGRREWEVHGSPRLLAISTDGTLVFVKPGAEAPNQWSIAELASTR